MIGLDLCSQILVIRTSAYGLSYMNKAPRRRGNLVFMSQLWGERYVHMKKYYLYHGIGTQTVRTRGRRGHSDCEVEEIFVEKEQCHV